jgi:hypothetical protein
VLGRRGLLEQVPGASLLAIETELEPV